MENKYILTKYEAEEYKRLRDNFEKEVSKMENISLDNRKWRNRILGYFVGFIFGALFIIIWRIL